MNTHTGTNSDTSRHTSGHTDAGTNADTNADTGVDTGVDTGPGSPVPPLPPLAEAVAAKITSRGMHGVVSATAPEAAATGRDALRDGGNAFDAALAAALAETVLLPPKCGLAGDLVALCQHPDRDPQALTAIGPAPAALAAAVRQRGTLPHTGGLAVGVPGAPAGYAALAQHGTRGLTPPARAAAALADDGIAWSPLNDRYARRSHQLLHALNPHGTRYLPHAGPHPVGSRVRLPGLARALTEFTHHGADLFHGPLGDALVGAARSHGGVITHDDLAHAHARWDTPATAIVAGQRVWTTPAPTHGPSLLAALTTAPAEPDNPAALHTAVEAAIHDRARHAGDTHPQAGTSVVTAADRHGNAVVLVHSNSHPTFGSGIVLDDYDLILANRPGRGFTATPGHPNFPAPGRRPLTTLHAWALGPPNNPPHTLGATSGGENQMPWNAQTLHRLLAGANPTDTTLAPLWARHPDGSTSVEHGLPHHQHTALAHTTPLTDIPRWTLHSSLQTIQLHPHPLTATADIRTIGGTASI